MMFSATLHSEEVQDIARRICHQPILVDLKVCQQVYSSGSSLMLPVLATREGSLLSRTKIRLPTIEIVGNAFQRLRTLLDNC